jgi:hypothetical protein
MAIRNKLPETNFYAKAQIHLAEEKISGIIQDLDWLLGLMENVGIADDKPADGQSFREKVEALKKAIHPQFSKDFGESLYEYVVYLGEELDHLKFGEGLYTQILPPSEWNDEN